MAQLAILGHETRGKEVIETLEMLGGKLSRQLSGGASSCGYYISSTGKIDYKFSSCFDDNVIKFTLEEFLENYPYKVGDRVQSKWSTHNHEFYIIKSMEWNNFIGQVYYTIKTTDGIINQYKWIAQEFMPYKEETMEENTDSALAPDLKGEDYSGRRFGYKIPKGYEFECVRENEIILKPIKLFPKTYEECCDILHIETNRIIEYDDCLGYRDITQYEINLLTQLRCFCKIRICRDAYWKIAGWNPKIKGEKFYMNSLPSCLRDLFPMPTEEMRDTFYENFKNSIEICKELL